MKELFLALVKYYCYIGITSAILTMIWISVLSIKAESILDKRNTVRFKSGKGPTFRPDHDRVRMMDYFMLHLGLGGALISFIAWPFILYILIAHPKSLYIIEEIETKTK